MAVSPRIVTEDVIFQWDGVSQRLPKGQVLDVPPDSALERAIGADHLVPLRGAPAQAPVQVPAEEAAPKEEPEPAAPPKAKPAAKKDDDAKDGDS